jgi:hypothetical protein
MRALCAGWLGKRASNRRVGHELSVEVRVNPDFVCRLQPGVFHSATGTTNSPMSNVLTREAADNLCGNARERVPGRGIASSRRAQVTTP